MDDGKFDELIRSAAGNTRRTAMRLLTGGALGALAARLGLSVDSAASQRRKHHQAGQKPVGNEVQVTRKGKGRKKKHKKPQLCSLDCTDGGGRCCPGGGGCAEAGECCPNEKRCPGYSECFAQEDCCPNATPPLCDECEDYACVGGNLTCKRTSRCCDGMRYCGGGVCVELDACCPDEFQCDDGTCIDPLDECCPDQKQCPGNVCISKESCCSGEKKCPGGNCVAKNVCCPGQEPVCGQCEAAVCENGNWLCQGNRNPCQDSCCPAGYYCHHLGSCCRDNPLECTCPDGYLSCAGWCCKSCCGSVCCSS